MQKMGAMLRNIWTYRRAGEIEEVNGGQVGKDGKQNIGRYEGL